MLKRCSVVAFFCVLHAADGKCSGDHCAPEDSAEMLLATKTRLSIDHGKAVEDGAQQLDLPKLLDFTQKTGLPNLLELQNTLDKMVSDTVNGTGNATASGNYTPTAAYDESITGLERTYDPTPKEEKAVNAIKEIKGFLANVLAATRKMHDYYQTVINNAAEQVMVVNSDMAASFATVEQLHNEREAARDKHRACRTHEATISRSTENACEGSKGINTIRLKKAPAEAEFPEGSAFPIEDFDKIRESWFSATSDGEMMVLFDAIKNVANFFSPDGDVMQSVEGCAPSVKSPSPYDIAKAECDRNQTVFEYADCAWHGENDQVCGLYKKRFDYEKKAYYSAEGITIRSEETRKAEHEAVQRIKCYLDVLNATQVNKSEMLANCRNAVHNADHLNIVYPRLEAKKYSCTVRGVAPADQTCGTSWTQTEYTDQAWYPGVTMQACQSCPTPAPTPAPTVKPQIWFPETSEAIVSQGEDTATSQVCLGKTPEYSSFTFDMLVTIVKYTNQAVLATQLDHKNSPKVFAGWMLRTELPTDKTKSSVLFYSRYMDYSTDSTGTFKHEYISCSFEGIDLNVEFRLTITYDSVYREAKCYVNGVNGPRNEAMAGCCNQIEKKTTDIDFASDKELCVGHRDYKVRNARLYDKYFLPHLNGGFVGAGMQAPTPPPTQAFILHRACGNVCCGLSWYENENNIKSYKKVSQATINEFKMGASVGSGELTCSTFKTYYPVDLFDMNGHKYWVSNLDV